MAQLSNN